MYRVIYEDLLKWKNKKNRKPLILEGMRQCGKTYILKEFGTKEYGNLVYLDFDKDNTLAELFEPDLDPDRILARLAARTKEKIEPGKTLIIFDEIQNCGRALTALKYFCQDAPDYHVACAGSLLGVLMSNESSFPVGKVDRIKMWPMTFKEYLLAIGETGYAENMDELVPTDDFMRPFAKHLEHHLDMFLTVGGMPAVVRSWIEDRDPKEVDAIIDSMIADYEKDFAKHAKGSVQKLTLIWNSIPDQLAKENKKFMFGHVKTGARARDLEDALEWLVNAGLVHKVKLADPSRLPLKTFVDNTCFKLYMADIGMLRRMSGLASGFKSDNGEGFELYRGALVENYVLCELVAIDGTAPYYWRSGGTAEVDFIIQYENRPIPIEVKSGRRTVSQSMTEYINKFKPKAAIIASQEMGDGVLVKKVPLWWLRRYEAVLRGTGGRNGNTEMR